MPTITTNDLKNGMSLDLDDGLFEVVEFQHVKPGKGGAFVRTKLKNVRSGAVIERTYRADEKLEQAIIDKREMQFLYREGPDYVFMDNESYEQVEVAEIVDQATDSAPLVSRWPSRSARSFPTTRPESCSSVFSARSSPRHPV